MIYAEFSGDLFCSLRTLDTHHSVFSNDFYFVKSVLHKNQNLIIYKSKTLNQEILNNGRHWNNFEKCGHPRLIGW